jgi:TM2 domain-containing membrane protein YozV
METNKPTESWNNPAQPKQENKKIASGILAILLGSFGIHKFLLGYTTEGIIQIVLNVFCGLGGFIGLIEGIIYLTKSDDEFYQTYQANKKGWF